jgi:hypothetical protein
MLHIEVVLIAVLFAMAVKGLWEKLGWWDEALVFVAVLFAMSLSILKDMASDTPITWPVRIFNALAHGGFSVWIWHWGGKQIAGKWSTKPPALLMSTAFSCLLFSPMIIVFLPYTLVSDDQQELIPSLSDQELQDRAAQERMTPEAYKKLYIETIIFQRLKQTLVEVQEAKEAVQHEQEAVKESKKVVQESEKKIDESLEKLEQKEQEIKDLHQELIEKVMEDQKGKR